MKWLNSREVKVIRKKIENQWGWCPPMDDYFFMARRDERVAIVSKEVERLDIQRVNTAGLYFVKIVSGEIKLTIEGSQIVGPKSKKNVVELNDEEVQQWIRGFDIPREGFTKGFLIIRNKNDYLGCTKHSGDKLHNLVPKERRIKSLQ